MMKTATATLVALTFGLLAASNASALLIDPTTGHVIDWATTPLVHPVAADTFDGVTYATYANDYAPIQYPGNIGHQPSPGGSEGEKWDLEELYARFDGNQFQALLVNSSGFQRGSIVLGDLFLTLNQQDYAITRRVVELEDLHDDGHHYEHETLIRFDLVRIDENATLIPLSPTGPTYAHDNRLFPNDYGPDDTVANVAGPWRVLDGTVIGQVEVQEERFNYGDDENKTRLIEYTVDLSPLDLDSIEYFKLHQTWSCGNDVIELSGTPGSIVPEPASLALLGLGGLLMWPVRRR